MWGKVQIILLILLPVKMFASLVGSITSQKSCSSDGQIDGICPFSSKASSQFTNIQYSEVPLSSFFQL